MAWNNLSFIDNTTSVTAVVGGVNSMADGWLIGGLMFALFIIIAIVFYGRVSMGEIITGSGFILSILALLFIKLSWLPEWSIGITIALLVFGLLSIFMAER